MTQNWFKTTMLMAAIMALFGTIGGMLGGSGGMLMALVLGGALNLLAYWKSDSMMLKMHNAQPVDMSTAPEFFGMVQELAARAGLPMPKVYVIHEDQPNAFATGRNPEHAAVAATTGIMRLLSYEELRGVMAHELAHVRNRDTLISTISATFAGAISSIGQLAIFSGNRQGNGISHTLLALLAPVGAMIIQAAISRTREYGADAGGAEISGDPVSLANALRKIDHYARNIPMESVERHPETAQMMIINPLTGHGGIDAMFRTHPQTELRINRLMDIARGIHH
jgi:heat shock protein HtpX